MGTNSISFSLGGPVKKAAPGKMGFAIKPAPKVAPVSAVFGADDSDDEEQDRGFADQAAKRQRLDTSGSAFQMHVNVNDSCRSCMRNWIRRACAASAYFV